MRTSQLHASTHEEKEKEERKKVGKKLIPCPKLHSSPNCPSLRLSFELHSLTLIVESYLIRLYIQTSPLSRIARVCLEPLRRLHERTLAANLVLLWIHQCFAPNPENREKFRIITHTSGTRNQPSFFYKFLEVGYVKNTLHESLASQNPLSILHLNR